jgi:hypothetical protein
MKTFYQHVRYPNDDGSISNLGGLTYAFTIDEEHVHFAVSVCSVNDNYSKKIGRQLSTERLNAYMAGSQILTGLSPEGQYPLAYSVPKAVVIQHLFDIDAFAAFTADGVDALLPAISLKHISIIAVISAIDFFFNTMCVVHKG